jgi:DNA-binding MarR family transcriptional regulator
VDTVDDAALNVWAEFLRVHATLVDVLGRELTAGTGLPLTWYDVLIQLHEAGGRLRMQDLASAIVLSKSGLTRLVDRLEAAGYVARVSCPSDRRGTFAELTASGRTELLRARPVHLRSIAEHFAAPLAAPELEGLGRALRTLARANDVAGQGAGCGGDERAR